MSKKEVTVHLETITPLWTGDAWQENGKIRPSSLMGSLRFWFEVICYFAGIVSKKEFDSNTGRFNKVKVKNEDNVEDREKKLINEILKNGNDIKTVINFLNNNGYPIPAIIFGTTGWKGLIEIKEIKLLEDYCFGNKLNLPERICISKQNGEIKENNDCPKSRDKNWSVFYLSQPYFYGKLEIKFLVEEEILNSIFYPLLNFMDKYGYWGGKWNIGYGKLRVTAVKQNNNGENWKIEKFNFSLFENKNDEEFGSEKYLRSVSNFDDLIQGNNKKIKILNKISDNQNSNNQDSNKDLRDVIKELIKQKAEIRTTVSNSKDRHYKFGKTGKSKSEDLPQGSKILPYIKKEIKKEEESFVGGFLSIVDLINLYGSD
ncbi:CRISPR-associated protein Cmr1 [Thermoanaerobacter thermohydrosulfuricus]|uniref:CRISPR-associated protein Cmr1 n=1 Tax=Thermoanaerobacter thermohydrosulfuricus TaxID=1516 RepID=A0A1G7PCR5_THETY|nr:MULTISPECIES: RAMP superfamily CRISPR-associated protein [Thermoanaerobacter]SDF83250.1 CRISPR-associated protein Cmr1 [Thermoanaerobacter thermohydrosulfuricus]SFE40796.1 CRISPR-associated protein Cmr1 [Thermoanaerobacter thermohydrosulfuricus]